MKNQAAAIRAFILQKVEKHPNNLVQVIMSHFNVSRTTVLRHINTLIKQNKIIKSGNTKQICYASAKQLQQSYIINLNDGFDEFDFFKIHISESLKAHVSDNCYDICEYVITEMLNNAKDHASAKQISVTTKMGIENFCCAIHDNGIGIFKHLQNHLKLENSRETIFELSKGKLTSDPANHSGEGIFFSSRSVDFFKISANGFCFLRDNLIFDWALDDSDIKKGTKVSFSISRKKETPLQHYFEQYTENFNFTKTDILVALSKQFGERLISRSQAKRVCQGLEAFTHITLDFKHVSIVGQGFVDEIFRVYQNKRDTLSIHYINANENIEFMIKRSIS